MIPLTIKCKLKEETLLIRFNPIVGMIIMLREVHPKIIRESLNQGDLIKTVGRNKMQKILKLRKLILI